MKGLVSLAAAILIVAPLTVGAQIAECEVDQTNPRFVGQAFVALQRATTTLQEEGDPTPDLQAALGFLTDPRNRDQDRNQLGQQFITGQAYVLLLGAGTPETVRAGEIGIQTNPEEMIDLVVAVDTLFRKVETAHPECVEVTSQFRRFQPWINMLNTAINTLNEGDLDAAERLARRSLLLYEDAPYAHSLLGAIAQQRDQDTEAVAHFRRALELALSDTIYADMVANTRGDIARTLGQRAQTAVPPQQAEYAREAIAAFEEYLAEADIEDPVRATSLAQVAALYQLAGEAPAALSRVYAPVLQNPDAYGETTLLQAGALAMSASAYSDAARLFATVESLNPYHRDALNNLAAAYIGLQRFSEVFPLVQRLVALEPNNPDAFLLYGYAYTGLLQDTRDAAQRRAYTDSLVKYTTLSEEMPVAVTFTEFSRLRSDTRLGGSIANRSAAPRSYTLSIELLGRDGSVVGTQEVTVGPVSAGTTERFRVEVPVDGANVFGYRYRPIS